MKLELEDASITINGLVSTCKCKCKHCLLCSGDNKIQEVPFDKLEKLALKFKGFGSKTGVSVGLAVYNCSDYPELPRAMEVDRQISLISGYQNLNGTPIRHGKELSEWVEYLKKHCGVTNANLSWFGTEAFHDGFVQRQGYYSYLLELAGELQRQNITYHNSVFILRSNLEQLEEIYNTLQPLGGQTGFGLLDYRGKAKKLLHEFLHEPDLKRLPDFLFKPKVYNAGRNKMKSEWLSLIANGNAPIFSKRAMLLVAAPENIDDYIKMTCDDIINMFHDIDSKLQKSIPSIETLADTYGSIENILIDFRSLLWIWTDMYFEDNPQLDKSLLFSDLYTSVMWR